jgi:glycosyltransferase involved in cell wall biosynthesis
MLALPPSVNTGKFDPAKRDPNIYTDYGVAEPRKLLYCGRVSLEKNLAMLADVFRRLRAVRNDVALVIAGEGPYAKQMRELLRESPAYFIGFQDDAQLAKLYGAADLFVFPSRTDTLGQVVIEAQACGLPAVVSNEGGPKETIADGVTGLVLPADDPARWARAIDELLSDEPRLQRMHRAAPQRATRNSLESTFEHFWSEHAAVVAAKRGRRDDDAAAAAVALPPTPAASL